MKTDLKKNKAISIRHHLYKAPSRGKGLNELRQDEVSRSFCEKGLGCRTQLLSLRFRWLGRKLQCREYQDVAPWEKDTGSRRSQGGAAGVMLMG